MNQKPNPNPHVYVINLKHRTDRKKQFQTAWSAAKDHHGVPTKNLHWYSAVLGSDLSDKQLNSFRIMAKTRKARAGRVGCYCSHTAAIKKAIRHNHFPLLVLEDDAVPTQHIENLTDLFGSAPQDAALLYFGALPVFQRKRVKNYCEGKSGWFSPGAGNEQLYGGHAYGFATKEAAQEVVDFLEKNKMTFDSALIRYTKLNRARVAVHCPFQFVQAEGYSNIEGMTRPIR